MDYVVQKATELGVHAIQPVFTARGVVRLDKQRAKIKSRALAENCYQRRGAIRTQPVARHP